jgi:low molecular weight phosphotyrosine protein phosphatase
MGEAVLADVAKQRGLNIQVDSAGTAGYHVGEEPDDRYVVATSIVPLLTSKINRTVAVCKKVNLY